MDSVNNSRAEEVARAPISKRQCCEVGTRFQFAVNGVQARDMLETLREDDVVIKLHKGL